MTHRSLRVHWTYGIQEIIIGYRCFSRIFVVKNWLSIFFKSNTYSDKNTASKYILKVNKRILEQDGSYFQS